jgi:cob(I)alamin adenosyltransferase
MKIYTRTGDKGTSALWGGERVSKSHPRIRAYGKVDELASWLGLLLAGDLEATISVKIARVQTELMTVASDLATPLAVPKKLRQLRTDESWIEQLESEIDDYTAQLPQLKTFILPGGSKSAAGLHYARSICRAAEREVVVLTEQEEINEYCLQYLNRLSDWLFTAARYQNHSDSVVELKWKV